MHEAAQKSGRSYNAEIVSALQEVGELRQHIASLEAAVKEQVLGRERDAKMSSTTIDAMGKLNRMLGFYLSTVASLVPKQSVEGKRMMKLISAMGQSVHAGDYANAVEAAGDLVKLSQEHGLLLPEPEASNTADDVAERLRAKPGLLD